MISTTIYKSEEKWNCLCSISTQVEIRFGKTNGKHIKTQYCIHCSFLWSSKMQRSTANGGLSRSVKSSTFTLMIVRILMKPSNRAFWTEDRFFSKSLWKHGLQGQDTWYYAGGWKLFLMKRRISEVSAQSAERSSPM